MGKFALTVRPNWCKSCGICIAYCPKKVLGFDESGKVSVQKPDECIGCRLCEFRCPDYAVEVGGEKIG